MTSVENDFDEMHYASTLKRPIVARLSDHLRQCRNVISLDFEWYYCRYEH